MSDVVRIISIIGSSISFHLRKLSNAKFSILYDISLVKDWKRKLWLITPGSGRVEDRWTACIKYKCRWGEEYDGPNEQPIAPAKQLAVGEWVVCGCPTLSRSCWKPWVRVWGYWNIHRHSKNWNFHCNSKIKIKSGNYFIFILFCRQPLE